MGTTWIPAASSRGAAAITSITMKGGTSLRAEGAMRSSADFSICSNCLKLLDEQIAVRRAPYGCRICRLGLSRVAGANRGTSAEGARVLVSTAPDHIPDSAAPARLEDQSESSRNDDASTSCQAAA